jgi:hypothetical protein
VPTSGITSPLCETDERNESDIGMPLSQWLQFLDYAYRGLRQTKNNGQVTPSLFIETIRLNTASGSEMSQYFTTKPT